MVFRITLHGSFLDCCKKTKYVHKQQRTANDDRKIQLKALYIIQLLIPRNSIFLSFPRHQVSTHFPSLKHTTNHINMNSKKLLSYNEHGNLDQKFFFWDNYSKPTWGLARFHFTYPLFKTLHFAHLKLVPLTFHNPPLRLPLEKHIFRKKQI